MKRNTNSLLRGVSVAAPCHESWDAMPGTDQVRSCERCQHKVYNLSEMSASEAESLIQSAEGRLCVRFYRRADGTVMTKDCPVGTTAIRQKRIAQATAGVAAAVGAASALSRPSPTLSTPLPVIQTTPQPRMGHMVMGAMARPEPIQGKVAVQRAELGELRISNPKTLNLKENSR